MQNPCGGKKRGRELELRTWHLPNPGWGISHEDIQWNINSIVYPHAWCAGAGLCRSLLPTEFNDSKLAAWNQPQFEYLHNKISKCYKPEHYFFLESWLLKHLPAQNLMDLPQNNLFYRWGNKRSERLSNLLQITQAIGGRLGIWTGLTPKPWLFPLWLITASLPCQAPVGLIRSRLAHPLYLILAEGGEQKIFILYSVSLWKRGSLDPGQGIPWYLPF